MFRALVWKEWKQLRPLLFAGIGLGALLPLVLVAGAEAGRRGLSPLGRLSAYSTRELFVDLLPGMLGLALWPSMALLATAQAYCGDRAAGTEWFLLERPVPRRGIWTARLIAVLSMVATLAVGTAALWLLTAGASGDLDLDGGLHGLRLLPAGLFATGLAVIGGTAAASFLAQPLAAVLLGGIFAFLPVALTFLLAGSFPGAAIGGLPLGLVTPWVLLPAFVLASYLGLCRGEPGGRGRLKRSSVAAAAGVAVALVSFVAAAPAAMRLDATWAGSSHPPRVHGSPGRACVVAGKGGWIVDLASAKRVRFLAAGPWGFEGVAWSADGRTLAVASRASLLGGVRARSRLHFYDDRGRPGYPDMTVPTDHYVSDVPTWAGTALPLELWVLGTEESELYVARPQTGTLRSAGFRARTWQWGILGTTAGDGAYLWKLENGAIPKGPVAYDLMRVDLREERVEPQPILRDRGSPWFAQWKLSPTGRYWIRLEQSPAGWTRVIRELPTGTDLPAPRVTRTARWLAGDRLVWTETTRGRTRLLTALPGGAPRPLREWNGADIELDPSPDRALVLVMARPASAGRGRTERREPEDAAPGPDAWESPAGRGVVPELLVFEPETNRWTRLPDRLISGVAGPWRTSWAGPRTIARAGPGVVELLDLDRLDSPRYVLGGPPS